ncbi:hypothetical protein C0991_001923, partial [Blastosporella zonata]
MAALVDYFITNFGVKGHIDHIPSPIALTVVVTAIQTFLVHCFFAQKILRSSKNNWLITAPILFLAFLRLRFTFKNTRRSHYITQASVTLSRIIPLRDSEYSFIQWVFTSGLALSAGVDVIITGWLCYFLRELRSRMGST